MSSPRPSRRRPAGRYDEPSLLGARLTALVLSVLFVALLTGIGTVLYARFFTEQVRARVIDFQVLSDEVVRIDLEVVKTPGSPAYCLLRARGSDGAEVGRDIVVVDARGTLDRVVRGEHDLATTARAVTGESAGCSAEPVPSTTPAP
ncbi:MAG: DUF4307 domain-containing protein [Mycobacteriales bacterium]